MVNIQSPAFKKSNSPNVDNSPNSPMLELQWDFFHWMKPIKVKMESKKVGFETETFWLSRIF